MDQLDLAVPEGLAAALPEDSHETIYAMQREIDQYQSYVNDAIADGDEAAARAAADIVDRLTERWEQYDTYIVELRSWGQSSIYAEVWCDFQYALIQQLYDHEELAAHLDQERHARLVDDGIRFRG